MRPLPVFRRLCALEQLELEQEYPRLLPALLRRGLGPEDALALAYNAALLRRVLVADPPLKGAEAVLGRYSLDEIADLCETYGQVAAEVLEYGAMEVD